MLLEGSVIYCNVIKTPPGTSLEVLWLRLHASTKGAQVQSLVQELRSCMLCGMTKKLKKKNFVAYNNKLEILCYSNVGWAELSGYKRRSISFVYLLLTPNSSGHQVGGVSLPNQTIP